MSLSLPRDRDRLSNQSTSTMDAGELAGRPAPSACVAHATIAAPVQPTPNALKEIDIERLYILKVALCVDVWQASDRRCDLLCWMVGMKPRIGNDLADVVRPTPIFVLGLQRSGTTWMANLLCQHPDCAGIQASDHHGIHESVFFSHFARAYGDLTEDSNYSRFLEDFGSSDYYQLSGLTATWLESQNLRSYPALFRALMDEVATRKGCSFWIEKSPHHTLLSGELAACFPDAKFICVRRGAADLMRSRLLAADCPPTYYPGRFFKLLRSCAIYALYVRSLENFTARNKNAILVSYEHLLEDLTGQLQRITNHVGLRFDSRMRHVPYRPNSSLLRRKTRGTFQDWCDRALISVFCAIFALVPFSFLFAAERLKLRRRGEPWPNWVWRRCPLAHEPPPVLPDYEPMAADGA